MGEVVQIRDYQKKKEPIDPANLNHMAVSIFNECFPQQLHDTAPSEMNPNTVDLINKMFGHVPSDDCA